MTRNLEVMKESVQAGLSPEKSPNWLKLGETLPNWMPISKMERPWLILQILGAARNAMAVNESNAKMGLVCATPTAGSAGCLPAVLTTAIVKTRLERITTIRFSLHCWCIWSSHRK